MDNVNKILNAKIDEIIEIKEHNYIDKVKFFYTKSENWYSWSAEANKLYNSRIIYPMKNCNDILTFKTLQGAKRNFIKRFLKEEKMLTYTQAKQCIKDLGRRGLEDLLKQYGEDVIISAFNCDIQPEDVEECYCGKFSSDEDFTQDLLESCRDMPKDLPLYIHIDWEATARDIMMDYGEDNGHYFRNI